MTAYVRVPRTELTAREVQVLELVARGKTNAQIGRELHVSEETVKRRIRDLRTVLGAVDRANAVNEGWRRGYLGEQSQASRSTWRAG